jgi:hypothetical protein
MRLREDLGRSVIGPGEVHDLVRVFHGGMRLGGLTGLNTPLVALTLFDSYLRLEPRYGLLRFTAPTWEARYDEIAEVQAVGFGGLSSGIRVFTQYGDWAVFSTRQRPEVLSAIANMKVPVNSSPISFNWKNPGSGRPR